jgi:5'-3' exonuclease
MHLVSIPFKVYQGNLMKDYSDIIKHLSERKEKQTLNSKVLICDGLNNFLRLFTSSPLINENGIHVGGLVGFLFTLGIAVRTLNPTRVIVVFDGKGGSARRRKLYPDYKENRRSKSIRAASTVKYSSEEVDMMIAWQLKRLLDYLHVLPVSTVIIDNIEADDSIAYISKQLLTESDIYIMSTDKDFLQLVDNRIKVWNPTSKTITTPEKILEKYQIAPENFIIGKMFSGDKGDNVPAFGGVGFKTVAKRFPMVLERKHYDVKDVLKYAYIHKNDADIYVKISDSENMKKLKLNYDLMQLQDVDISGAAKMKLIAHIQKTPKPLVKIEFQKLMIKDSLNIFIKNPDLWLRENFSRLNLFTVSEINVMRIK